MIVTIEVDLPDQTIERFTAAGVDLKAYAGRFLAKSLPAFAPAASERSTVAAPPLVDPENAAGVALLQFWATLAGGKRERRSRNGPQSREIS